jgi:hypothetical protein
VVLIDP